VSCLRHSASLFAIFSSIFSTMIPPYFHCFAYALI
jgi:hypothetical protein